MSVPIYWAKEVGLIAICSPACLSGLLKEGPSTSVGTEFSWRGQIIVFMALNSIWLGGGGGGGGGHTNHSFTQWHRQGLAWGGGGGGGRLN